MRDDLKSKQQCLFYHQDANQDNGKPGDVSRMSPDDPQTLNQKCPIRGTVPSSVYPVWRVLRIGACLALTGSSDFSDQPSPADPSCLYRHGRPQGSWLDVCPAEERPLQGMETYMYFLVYIKRFGTQVYRRKELELGLPVTCLVFRD